MDLPIRQTLAIISAFILIALPSGKCESENPINRYEGYKVYDVRQRTPAEVSFLHQMHANASLYNMNFLRLNMMVNDYSRVMVPPRYQKFFEIELIKHQMLYRVYIDNVKGAIDREKLSMARRRAQVSDERLKFDTYYRHEQFNNYLDELERRFPDMVSVMMAGKSTEQREIKVISIFGDPPDENKPIVLIDAGAHAREWIGPATALYIIHELVEHADKYSELLANFNFVVLPLVNPDGYEFTHTNDRLWRKTRKRYGQCHGADPNRNFDHHWCGKGTSNDPCDDTYCGPSPFSEPETRIVKSVMDQVRGRCKLYMSLHSYGNYILHPWGYDKVLTKNVDALTDIGMNGADAIRKATGSEYQVGSSANLLYPAAGGSDDYAMAVEKIPFTYTLELSDEGSGFDPPPSRIESIASESWVGVQAMIWKVLDYIE